jgi:hypothetical protein
VAGGSQSLVDGVPNPLPESAREIGWEMNMGFDWKILEHLIWKARFAYWQPGAWWSFAYPNTAWMHRALPGTDLTTLSGPVAESLATYGRGRKIDPLFAIETSLLIEF